ncbi:MerR family transcriptional regulator [Leucothrix arctica]|uniref:Transcriptional regulator n=1 Tax=Leucothrix arctica TaxID=1481894 RepID=A0A317CT83_9GAMM|nr:MerR family transcriptional regulator [Leucothrix arctica]PWQ99640.1 transcriptional regulator [Leucothrix arctica]
MFIGQVSKSTGATRKAIRHYESIGLIATPERKGSYRFYSDHDVTVILMIRQAQSLGFSLSELKEVVSKKTTEKKLPFDLICALIDSKKLALQKQAEQLLTQATNLENFKADLLKTLS